MEVFCSECKFFKYKTSYHVESLEETLNTPEIDNDQKLFICMHKRINQFVIKKTPIFREYREVSNKYTYCYEKNKDNDCKDFESI